MATETKNYQFIKPEETDFYDINVYRDFLEKIDAELYKTRGLQILWRGALLEGGSIEFTIPKECFHNNNTTLTLILDGYYSQKKKIADAGGNIGITGVTFCFGKDSDFGMAYPSGSAAYGPYMDGDNNVIANIYRVDTANGISAALNVKVKVRKVPDTRYAVCMISTLPDRNSDETITCVSAIVPQELGV